MGGIVIGYEIGRQLDIETIFAERVDNKLELRRGFSILKQAKVLIVEDVITTGKSAKECHELVKNYKAELIGYACIIDRSNNESLIRSNIVSQIKIDIKTFKEDELPESLKKIPAIKPGSRNLL